MEIMEEEYEVNRDVGRGCIKEYSLLLLLILLLGVVFLVLLYSFLGLF